jgi:putative addiction module component
VLIDPTCADSPSRQNPFFGYNPFMPATIEQIKQDIRSLAPDDVDHLLRDLQQEYVMPSVDEEESASVEAEWDAEIDRRVQEIEEGKVELISGAEFQRQTDALFAELGLKRLA